MKPLIKPFIWVSDDGLHIFDSYLFSTILDRQIGHNWVSVKHFVLEINRQNVQFRYKLDSDAKGEELHQNLVLGRLRNHVYWVNIGLREGRCEIEESKVLLDFCFYVKREFLIDVYQGHLRFIVKIKWELIRFYDKDLCIWVFLSFFKLTRLIFSVSFDCILLFEAFFFLYFLWFIRNTFLNLNLLGNLSCFKIAPINSTFVWKSLIVQNRRVNFLILIKVLNILDTFTTKAINWHFESEIWIVLCKTIKLSKDGVHC